uniref:hypothetical protein n=1 Tax=Flavobacterium sp. TaxID=239 RepID=UPI00404B1DFF
MKKRLLIIVSFISVLTLSSCATLFNSVETHTRIITSQPSKLTINGEENSQIVDQKTVWIKRTQEPLEITAESTEHKKTVLVNAKNSFMFWANLYNYGIGMLIDKDNPKRYYYPQTIYIDLQDSLATYQTYVPNKISNDSLNSLLKITPLKLIGFVNPGLELAYERKISPKFSTQFMYSLLFDYGKSNSILTGFRTSIEHKFFYRKSAPVGPYVSFEINYLQKKYYDTWNFGEADIYNNPDYEDTNYSDTYGINKKTLSFNFKWGYQKIVSRFVIDFYAGLGLKYRDVQHFDRINPNDEMESTPHLNVYFIGNQEAKGFSVSLPLSLKIGWTF